MWEKSGTSLPSWKGWKFFIKQPSSNQIIGLCWIILYWNAWDLIIFWGTLANKRTFSSIVLRLASVFFWNYFYYLLEQTPGFSLLETLYHPTLQAPPSPRLPRPLCKPPLCLLAWKEKKNQQGWWVTPSLPYGGGAIYMWWVKMGAD